MYITNKEPPTNRNKGQDTIQFIIHTHTLYVHNKQRTTHQSRKQIQNNSLLPNRGPPQYIQYIMHITLQLIHVQQQHSHSQSNQVHLLLL